MSITVVTGAGSGIGRGIALALLGAGKTVLLTGRRQELLQQTAALSPDPSLSIIAAGDLTTHTGVRNVKAALDGKKLRAVVAAAGGQGDFYRPGTSVEEIDAAWTEALRKNLFSALLLIELLLPEMQDAGRIVLIGSTAGLDGKGGPYAAAKAALHGYGRDLALRVGNRKVTVNTIAPGYVEDTEFFDSGLFGDPVPLAQNYAKRILLGRTGKTADIAACVQWLLSEEAGWITGQTISINGGTVFVR